MLSPDTIKAIEDHKRNARLAESMRQGRERQIRRLIRHGQAKCWLVPGGIGWEDLLDPKHNLEISREDARAAVLWGPK